ncbi:ribosome biogenesis nsa2 protein [Rutstroemia sp. NJR-2017a BVV2]|nr:ribosome biogenesis nsa2 protein [Rutstroemia sp. NJR-2017a BVV2]PQE18528.1 ribosome biogenesis nsa2 protein [Rutstroemia sp. NJR-2017a BVV2]
MNSAESGAYLVERAGLAGMGVEVGATAGLGGVIGALETVFEVLVPLTGGSTCCAVALMNRARFGRRKVGGSVALGVRMSNKDLLSVLLNMPQNEYMERWRKLHGRRLDHEERARKKAAREGHKASEDAQKLTGLRAKLYQKKRHHEKIQMKKQIKAHEERNVKSSAPSEPSSTPLPQYLLDRSNPTNAKALSSAIKNKRAEKAAKFSVPLPKVRGIAEEEMFKVVKTGKKTAKKGWKRMITKPTFVGPDFTRRPVKYERFIRPMGLRYKKANVTHPELGVTVQLPIISVKKNPQNPMYTQLGVLTRGTIVEVNVSDLGLTTAGGKIVWGRWAQIKGALLGRKVAMTHGVKAFDLG